MTHPVARRASGLSTTVFSEYSALAQRHRAVNLGQGTPDFDAPEEVVDAALRALCGGENQYPPVCGTWSLRTAIAEHAARFYGQRVDPETMVTVTSGATEALMATVLALVEPGDEVVVFEPFYDAYPASVAIAGGRIRAVALQPPDAGHATWWFREADLAAAFTARTRLLLLNTPHNPTGKVFTLDELEVIAAQCRRHRVPALVDEVYEHIVFGEARHVRLGGVPGMEDLTITVGSCGKNFSVTGWKVGWAIAAPRWTTALRRIHQFVTFSTASPLQAAAAHALRLPDRYFQQLARDYALRREQLRQILDGVGLRPLACDGTYFLLVDVSARGFASDHAFCRTLIEQVGVGAIPVSPFVSEGSSLRPLQLARFAFCKRSETLRIAGERLRARSGSLIGCAPEDLCIRDRACAAPSSSR